MDYYKPHRKHDHTEMKTFDPVVMEPGHKEPPRPFDDRNDAKEKRNKDKETRISIAMIVLTFLASVCVLFGTLFPELSRGEVDMRPFRDILASAARQQAFLIRDRVTLVNLGLWRYCYDDQLYDLVEIINPTMQFNKRSLRETAEETEEEGHSIEKRQSRQGDISIRCHPIPEPWKMPYFVKKKTDATKVCLIIGVVACILSFLNSILVLITRFPGLKFLQLFLCFAGVIAGSVAIGLNLITSTDLDGYTRSHISYFTRLETGQVIDDAFGSAFAEITYGIISGKLYNTESNIECRFGVCSLLIALATGICGVNVGLAELHRNVSGKV